MEERIQHLFRKYLDNTCTREEYDEVFAQLRKQHSDDLIGESLDQAYEREFRKLRPRGKISRTTTAIAASALIAITAGTVWMMSAIPGREYKQTVPENARTDKKITKMTQRSEYKYLLLPDSTQVWLNAASTLEFPDKFDKERREVYLKGEAYFDVRHADKVPFIIYTGNVSTEVLGTAFNIKAYPGLEKITVSVKRGKVKVNYGDKAVAVLTKGEQVSIGSKDRKVKERPIADQESAPWHEGNLVYDDYSIADIVSDLERIYDVKVRIAVPEIAHMRVSTSSKREYGVERLLDILCRLTDARYRLEKGIYIIDNHQ